MWLFLINPLKLCSYGSWSLQGYVCKSSCCQCHIYIYTLAWILKCLKLYPSISLIDDSAAATQPLSRCARVADAATQPLCQSGWSSHSATLPEWLEEPLSHSATLPEWLEQPLSHSVTLPEWLEQPLSHSVTLPEWLEQPLSHSATLSDWVAASATLPEWLSGWCENFRHCAFNLILCDIFGIFRDVMEVRRYKHGNHECLMASSSHFQDKFHTEPSQPFLFGQV